MRVIVSDLGSIGSYATHGRVRDVPGVCVDAGGGDLVNMGLKIKEEGSPRADARSNDNKDPAALGEVLTRSTGMCSG